MPRRRKGDSEEELEGEVEAPEGPAGDLGTMLLNLQEGAGNAVVADLLERVESGEAPATAILPGGPVVEPPEPEAGDAEERRRAQDEEERRRRGIAARATYENLRARVAMAKAHAFAPRLADRITSFHRRLEDAREYGWLGTDAEVMSAEMTELEAKLVHAAGEEEAAQALTRVDAARLPVSQRLKVAITECTALAKPGLELYAPEDFETLGEMLPKLGELQKRMHENRDSVVRSRHTLGNLSEVATGYAKGSAASLLTEVDALSLLLEESEGELAEIAERHAHVGREDREALNKLMEGLKPPLAGVPRKAMAGGAGKQEIDYLTKKAWIEQHEETQKLNPDELWQLLAGFSPNQGKVRYFDLPQRMGNWRIHFSLDYGVMKAVDVAFTEPDVRDALLGGSAAVVMRAHATAEVLGRSNDANPHYYYGTDRVTPRSEFWSTPKGKEAERNWAEYEAQLMAAFDAQADGLVGLVYAILRDRLTFKAKVIQVNEALVWAD